MVRSRVQALMSAPPLKSDTGTHLPKRLCLTSHHSSRVWHALPAGWGATFRACHTRSWSNYCFALRYRKAVSVSVSRPKHVAERACCGLPQPTAFLMAQSLRWLRQGQLIGQLYPSNREKPQAQPANGNNESRTHCNKFLSWSREVARRTPLQRPGTEVGKPKVQPQLRACCEPDLTDVPSVRKQRKLHDARGTY
jgi:hypothetical protein